MNQTKPMKPMLARDWIESKVKFPCTIQPKIDGLWKKEKQVAVESIAVAKNEALTFLAKEREKIMRMSHEEALLELVRVHKIESRIKTIKSVTNNDILTIGA